MKNLNFKHKLSLNNCQSHTGYSFQDSEQRRSALKSSATRSQALDLPESGAKISQSHQRERSPGVGSVRLCDRCGGTLTKTGAGRKPGEESQSCLDCGQFLGYQPIKQLKRLRRRKKLTDCLNLLESHGIVSQEAQIFLLSEVGEVGAIGGES